VWLLYIIILLSLRHAWTLKYLTWKILDFILTLSGPSARDCLTKIMFCPNIELSKKIIKFKKIDWNWARWYGICSLQRMPFVELSLISGKIMFHSNFKQANYFKIQMM
jgi:hypothetical protein